MQRTTIIQLTYGDLLDFTETVIAQGIAAYEKQKQGQGLLTTKEAAELKMVTPQTIRNAIASGELKADLISKRKYGIARHHLDAYRPRLQS